MVQQFAHIGIGGHVDADPDYITDTNTNRLIGGTLSDVKDAMLKVAIAERLIRGLQPHARIVSVPDKWQNATEHLKRCDIILGAVDGFIERDQLERFARRHLIPYIDIGMDVHDLGEHGHLVAGQVILSTPGFPCLRCCGFITDERLEARGRALWRGWRPATGGMAERRPCLDRGGTCGTAAYAVVSAIRRRSRIWNMTVTAARCRSARTSRR